MKKTPHIKLWPPQAYTHMCAPLLLTHFVLLNKTALNNMSAPVQFYSSKKYVRFAHILARNTWCALPVHISLTHTRREKCGRISKSKQQQQESSKKPELLYSWYIFASFHSEPLVSPVWYLLSYVWKISGRTLSDAASREDKSRDE